MKKFILGLGLLFVSSFASAQGVNGSYLRITPTSLPSLCRLGDVRVDSVSGGLNLCGASNNWALLASGSSVPALTTLGDTLYEDATPAAARLPGNTTSTKKFLTQTGTGTISAAPAWNTILGSDLPNPSASTLGGVQSYAAVSNQWINSISTSGVPSSTQPAFTNISGTVAASQLPNPSASTLGGVQSAAPVSNQWINSISTSGVPALSQPAFSNISGQASLTTQVSGTLPIANGGTNNGSLGVVAGSMYYGDGSKLVSMGAGTSGQVPISAGSTVGWGTPTGGLIAEREFNTNTTIDVNATGYNAYANTAQSTPVTGTGGAPNTTCARSTSSPITGAGSLLINKAGSANRQGEGCSIDFTVDTGAGNASMAFEFDYNVASGTFTAGVPGGADSDIEIFIYDKTNGKLVALSDFKLYTSSATPTHYVQTFQGSSSLSYRAIFHIATTTTNNFGFQADNISVHPGRPLLISPVSDLVKTTSGLAPSAGYGTVTSANYYYRRVGDSMEVTMTWVNGTAAASSAYIALPFTIDSTKLPSNSSGTIVGFGGRNAPVASRGIFSNNDAQVVFYDGSTTDRVFITTNDATAGFVKLNVTDFTNSSEPQSISFKVPILGWTATQAAVRTDQSNFGWTDGGVNSITSTGGGVAKGTMARDKVWYRRNGQNLQVRIEFDMTGAGTAGTGDYLFLIPGGYSADTTVAATFTSTSIQHDPSNLGGAIVSNTTPTPVSGFVSLYDATHVRIAITDANNHFASATFYSLGTANQSYAAEYSVPIAGWTENQSAPMLVGTVFSNTGGQERIERAVLNISGASTGSVVSQSGSWISSVSVTSTVMTVNFTNNMWSTAPTCVLTCNQSTGVALPDITVTPTTSTMAFNCVNLSSTAITANAVQLICMGPR